MSTYAIGDVQGCHEELLALLDEIDFDPGADRLWFAGDLVNRGPASLAVLELVYSLRECSVVVLGNHDLHLLACAYIDRFRPGKKDTFEDVLEAEQAPQLLAWLRCQPLLHRDPALGYAMVHAGLPWQWTLQDASEYASEVQDVLSGDDFLLFLEQLYGNKPNLWDANLRGWDRLRLITNYLTRLRFTSAAGHIDFKFKGALGSQPAALSPWYDRFALSEHEESIVFGHWSALHLSVEQMQSKRIYALDTGAVWGGRLTAMRLEDGRRFDVASKVAMPITD